jgi:hypothetical protein
MPQVTQMVFLKHYLISYSQYNTEQFWHQESCNTSRVSYCNLTNPDTVYFQLLAPPLRESTQF